jgi:hypothetical protein
MPNEFRIDIADLVADRFIDLSRLRRTISGTYKNSTPASNNMLLELRVDVDDRRPQQRISGDVFKRRGFRFFDDFVLTPAQQLQRFDTLKLTEAYKLPFSFTTYEYSFVVETVAVAEEGGAAVLSGPIIYYGDPGRNDETIEVRIRRVSIFSSPPEAAVNIYKAGLLVQSYCLPKISEFFRIVTLEIDRFEGTSFPPSVSSDVSPSPADLPVQIMTTASVFRRAGIDLTVVEDDVLNDADSGDAGTNWSEAELHDLMEDRFDRYSNSLQWNTYGVIVPRFGDPNYDSGYYGTMFDWGGWQAGDTYFRQGCAIADEATRGRTSGTLYDSAVKEDRLVLETFCHEVGHSFNLPHSWQRGVNADSASESFMNYPWGYTGGSGESGFWSNFRWEFDDVELIWMRHQDRRDVIFGGRDWSGNNLSIYVEPESEITGMPLRLQLSVNPILDFAEPVHVTITLTNISDSPILAMDRLHPEDYFVTLYLRTPSGEFVRYVPPVRRLKSPGDPVELKPGQSLQQSALISFSAKGIVFQEPGEYRMRAYYGRTEEAAVMSRSLRFRVAAPRSAEDEELAYLLFSPAAAKFLYFRGTERYPAVGSQLEEAVNKFKGTHPRIVRHIREALGVHAGRAFKRVEERKGERVVVTRKPKAEDAVTHLQGVLSEPEEQRRPLSPPHYAQIVRRLADVYRAQGAMGDALKTLQAGIQYLSKVKADPSVTALLEETAKRTGRKPEKK